MAGGLVQLVAQGAQDAYLTTKAQVTFWKVVYRRYTNFALEAIAQTFNGTSDFNKRVSATISRNGDLVYKMFIEIVLKKSATASYFPAEAIMNQVELEIGGTRIDLHYNDWYRVYSELFRTSDEKTAYRRMTDFVDGEAPGTLKRFYLPLTFFFCKAPGVALPLIALQYHEVKINITYSAATDVIGVDPTFTPDSTLWCDYVYLDVDERRRFAQSQHEYLIEQLQFTGDETVSIAQTQRSQNIRMSFNHPTKYLTWVVKGQVHGQYTGGPLGTYAEAFSPLYSAKIQLNGHDRFNARMGSYFNQVQPYQSICSRPMSGISLYSFSLRPIEHQPSGTCNFSRIDNATLQLSFKGAATQASQVTDVLNEGTTVGACTNLTALKVYAVDSKLGGSEMKQSISLVACAA